MPYKWQQILLTLYTPVQNIHGLSCNRWYNRICKKISRKYRTKFVDLRPGRVETSSNVSSRFLKWIFSQTKPQMKKIPVVPPSTRHPVYFVNQISILSTICQAVAINLFIATTSKYYELRVAGLPPATNCSQSSQAWK